MTMTPIEAAEVLGVTSDAPGKEVARAYRDRMREVHPDSAPGRAAEPGAEVERLKTARQVLTAPPPAEPPPLPPPRPSPVVLVARPVEEPDRVTPWTYTGPARFLWTYTAVMVGVAIWQILDALT